ncbi:iron ABC transporter permease [Geobacillus sp. FSL K6-0789]|uniref:ABC-type Fe3+-siderophore transport system permease 2 component n=2 Tax=Geobacillus stearothermophilus TaxID=1422 RepID=A0A0K9HK60_GEOSE|nr:iron ABC transporter permease [Geobacillus stearothermophilus]KAF6509318.1 ABC-type Fe3+-siderophore transport system permease 2 component [Geobacillus stearothermophilus]KMY59335.1 iron ABC transporter permease [Geobacillus stearothermophilus]KMY64583.1 iron ABC transporter permease [Geobacillus stearothermophilus]KOR91998.1 iron ABC transporter permease [Geobacillus stearothermophilus ATCC 12980]MED3665249.1 iron ABC transporter permease [Geobacillus stearothermophilus]
MRKKSFSLFAVLALLIAATAAVALSTGDAPLSYNRIVPTLLGYGSMEEEFILFSLRLPRLFITLLAGMALALSGAVLQGLTRNDLADPGVLGINAGAGAGVALFFLFFPIEAGTFLYALPLVAFTGAILTAVAIYAISYKKTTGLQPVPFILTGVGMSMALSGLMIVLISAADRTKVDFIARWLSGNIWGDDWPFIWAVLPWLAAGTLVALYRAKHLNILHLGDPVSIGVGVHVRRERLVLMTTAIAVAAAAVSVTGSISFIGLMAPHIAKSIVGPRHERVIPASMLIGGWLLLAADTIGRNVLAEPLPAGVIVSLIGAPYFIYLLLKR